MKRLANYLYNLEYLDLEGCTDWLPALRWTGFPSISPPEGIAPEGIDWDNQWVKLKMLIVRCGYVLHEGSEYWEVKKFTEDFRRMFLLPKYLARVRKGKWIEVVRDDWEAYDGFWKDGTEESKRKRGQIVAFRMKWWAKELNANVEEAPTNQDVERRSVWEQ